MRHKPLWDHEKLARDIATIKKAYSYKQDRIAAASKYFCMGIEGILDDVLGPNGKVEGHVQAFTTHSDHPAQDSQVTLPAFHEIPDLDLGYQLVFDMQDRTDDATNGNSFKIPIITSGVTFRKHTALDAVDVFKSTGSEIIVMYDRFSGAVGMDLSWFFDNDFESIESQSVELVAASEDIAAEVGYALISATRPDSDVAWQSAGEDVTRDIATINFAGDSILASLRDQGMRVTGDPELVILAPSELRSRIIHAVSVGYPTTQVTGGATALTYRVSVANTSKLTNLAGTAILTDQYFVCLPERKNKWGNRENFNAFEDMDILSFTKIISATRRFGAVIGETGQFRRCATA